MVIIDKDGLIWDGDYNITWLKDAGYAQTSGYDSDGYERPSKYIE